LSKLLLEVERFVQGLVKHKKQLEVELRSDSEGIKVEVSELILQDKVEPASKCSLQAKKNSRLFTGKKWLKYTTPCLAYGRLLFLFILLRLRASLGVACC
jgi:hypothetical protein